MNLLVIFAAGFIIGYAAMSILRVKTGNQMSTGEIFFQNAIFIILAVVILAGMFTGFGEYSW